MLLAIDSGNTNVVFAVYDGNSRKAVWRCGNNPKRTADEYAVWLTQLFELEALSPKDIHAAILASVVPETKFNILTLCREYFDCDPMQVDDPSIDLGLEVLLSQPDQVGDDRLANGVAAFSEYGGPLIIVDFGTATTFYVIDENGNYVGGVIAPGINLSVEALFRAASRLPLVSIELPEKVIGKATVPAMQSGIFWGYIGLIEGLVSRISKEYGADMKVVATGGLAQIFADATGSIHVIDSDLTTRGLVQIFRRNIA